MAYEHYEELYKNAQKGYSHYKLFFFYILSKDKKNSKQYKTNHNLTINTCNYLTKKLIEKGILVENDNLPISANVLDKKNNSFYLNNPCLIYDDTFIYYAYSGYSLDDFKKDFHEALFYCDNNTYYHVGEIYFETFDVKQSEKQFWVGDAVTRCKNKNTKREVANRIFIDEYNLPIK